MRGIFVFLRVRSIERVAPNRVKEVAISLSWRGINGSGIDGNINQLMVAPPKMAPIERNKVGIEMSRSLLLIW